MDLECPRCGHAARVSAPGDYVCAECLRSGRTVRMEPAGLRSSAESRMSADRAYRLLDAAEQQIATCLATGRIGPQSAATRRARVADLRRLVADAGPYLDPPTARTVQQGAAFAGLCAGRR